MAIRGMPGVLLERAEELAAVDVAISDALGGSGRVVAIEGPAGIGKSSVLGEGRARAVAAGMTVLNARGTEIERPFAYGVVRQLFETLVVRADADERAPLLAGAAAQAGRLFDLERVSDPTPASEDTAFALLHGLYWLSLNLADSRPLLIAVDDLQWADAESLRWLLYLAGRLEGTAVGVLASMRLLEEDDPVLAELLADVSTTTIRPSALTAPAVAEIVRAGLSADADDAFCLACHRTTGGNPLLVHELVRTLASAGVEPSAASVPVVERLAPDAVARSVKLRLSRLPEDAAALAHAVAVLGDCAKGLHAAALAGIEQRALGPAAAGLARVGLLLPEPPLRFVHPVLRNAVYEARDAHERAQDHARAAEIRKVAGAAPAQVAAHVLLAPPGSVDGAAAILYEAAQRAASEAGLESASRYLRRGLDESMPDEERAALLLELAAIELNLGSVSVIDRLQEAIGLLDDPERLARARLQLGRALYWAGREEDGVRVLEEALAEWTGADDLRRRLQAELVANATRLAGRFEEARRLLGSLEVAADEGPGARMLLGLQAYHEAARGGSRERVVERTQQAFAAMSDDERRWNSVGPSYTLLVSDHLDEPVHVLDTLIAHARTDGAVFNFAGLSIMRAAFHYARGALVEAEADAESALGVIPHRHVSWAPFAYGWLAQILVERRQVDEAAAIVDTGEGAIASSADSFSRTPLLRARATVAAARGDHETTLTAAIALGESLTAYGQSNPAFSYPSWRSLAAQAQLALGRTDEALRLAREDVVQTRAWGAPRALGRALRILGLIEGSEDGLERIGEAVELLEHSPARLEYAYALADLGGALRRANRRAAARDPLRAALELAHQCGATLLGERAHQELVAAGARPRRLVLTGIDALTPSERQIAAMAAGGLSNREIAQALFVTLRTVEMHLSNTFRKLDISSRTQLPEALAPRPWRRSSFPPANAEASPRS